MKNSKQIFLSMLCLMINIMLQGSKMAAEVKPSLQTIQKAAKALKATKLSHGNYKVNGRAVSGMELVEMWQKSHIEKVKPMTVHELKAKIVKIQADNLKAVSDLYNYKIHNQEGPFQLQQYDDELKSVFKNNAKNKEYHEKLLNQLMDLENEINQTFKKQLNYLEEMKMIAD